jgi:hypothetical protein
MSYGTGRPAILKDDESIWQCRFLLRHPLAVEDDMRLVSMVELMAIRERITNHLSPYRERARGRAHVRYIEKCLCRVQTLVSDLGPDFLPEVRGCGYVPSTSVSVFLTHRPSQVSTAKASRFSSCTQNCIIAPLRYEV